MKAKTLAILQARTSSSRLPGKVLMPILERPVLFLQIERLMRCIEFDQLVVATSIDPSDDILAAVCEEFEVVCIRGSLDDVMDRFVQAAIPFQPDTLSLIHI